MQAALLHLEQIKSKQVNRRNYKKGPLLYTHQYIHSYQNLSVLTECSKNTTTAETNTTMKLMNQ